MSDPIELNGLDGANPLGFLAALGTLVVSEQIWPETKMSWRPYANSFRPVLHGPDIDLNRLSACLINWLETEVKTSDHMPAWTSVDLISDWDRSSFRSVLTKAAQNNQHSRQSAMLVGLASDAVPGNDKMIEGARQPTALSHANGQGHQKLFKFHRQNLTEVDADRLYASLNGAWKYMDHSARLRWDPQDGRIFPVGVGSANTQSVGVECAAQVLAFNAISCFTTYPGQGELRTTGYKRLRDDSGRSSDFLTWPIWESPQKLDVIRSLLNLPILHHPTPERSALNERGLLGAFRCRRIVDVNTNLFFGEAVAV